MTITEHYAEISKSELAPYLSYTMSQAGNFLLSEGDVSTGNALIRWADDQLEAYLNQDVTGQQMIKDRALAMLLPLLPASAPAPSNPLPVLNSQPQTFTPPPVQTAMSTQNVVDPITGAIDPISTIAQQDQFVQGSWDWVGPLAGAIFGGGGGAPPPPISGFPTLPPQGGQGTPTGPTLGQQVPLLPDWVTSDQVKTLLGYIGIGSGSGGSGSGSSTQTPAQFQPTGPTLPAGPPTYQNWQGQNLLTMPSAVAPMQDTRLKAPRGYVIVSIKQGHPTYDAAKSLGGVLQSNGDVKIAMLKSMARKAGWKPRQKPLLTASDGRILKKARRLESKLERETAKAGVVVTRADVKHYQDHH